MKKTLALCAFLLVASAANAQALFQIQKAQSSVNVPSFVQVTPVGSNSTGTSIPFTFGTNVTSGNTLVMWMCWIDPTATFVSFSKSSGTATIGTITVVGSNGTGTPVKTGNDSCNDAFVSVTGSGTLTMQGTVSSSVATYIGAAGSEYSLVAASPLDNQAMQFQTSQSGTNAATSGSATTTSSGDLIFGFNFDFNNNASQIAAGTGFNGRYSGTSGVQQEDLVQASAGTIAATFTYTGGTSDTTISGMIALKHS